MELGFCPVPRDCGSAGRNLGPSLLLGMTSVVLEGFGDVVTDGWRGWSSQGAGAVKPDKMYR
jgi:hypothetical protein